MNIADLPPELRVVPATRGGALAARRAAGALLEPFVGTEITRVGGFGLVLEHSPSCDADVYGLRLTPPIEGVTLRLVPADSAGTLPWDVPDRRLWLSVPEGAPLSTQAMRLHMWRRAHPSYAQLELDSQAYRSAGEKLAWRLHNWRHARLARRVAHPTSSMIAGAGAYEAACGVPDLWVSGWGDTPMARRVRALLCANQSTLWATRSVQCDEATPAELFAVEQRQLAVHLPDLAAAVRMLAVSGLPEPAWQVAKMLVRGFPGTPDELVDVATAIAAAPSR